MVVFRSSRGIYVRVIVSIFALRGISSGSAPQIIENYLYIECNRFSLVCSPLWCPIDLIPQICLNRVTLWKMCVPWEKPKLKLENLCY